MKHLILLALSGFLVASCSTVLDQKIEPETLEANIEKIKSDTKIDSNNIYVLDFLVALNEGRDAYEEWRDYSSSLFVVADQVEFDAIKESLFEFIAEKEITYTMLFDEIGAEDKMQEEFDAEYADLYKRIDEFCVAKQVEQDDKDKLAEEMKARLNEMVELEIVSIRETERDYRDVVEVKIKMTNKTDKPIEALSFYITLTDKLGNELATLGCRSNNRFVNSDFGYWIYGRWDESDIYKSLKNVRLSHVTYEYEIDKINHDGELLSVYGSDDDYLSVNYDYNSSGKLTGYCPYLDDEDELSHELAKAEEAKNDKLAEATPTLNKILDAIGDLMVYDPSSLYDY